MAKRFIVLALGVALLLFLAGCADSPLENANGKNTKAKQASEKKKLTGKALEKKVLDDINKDLDVYVGVRENVKDYEKAFIGTALSSIKQQYEKDKKDGRLKIRVHNNRKVDKVSVSPDKGYGEAKYTFTDASYYVDFKTKENRLTEPEGTEEVFLLALKEDKDGRWKIASIFLPAKAPHGELKKDPATGKYVPAE
ncbi:MAG: hypothetical protein ACYC1U_11240 [Candidatus Aquicultorales bacterium]